MAKERRNVQLQACQSRHLLERILSNKSVTKEEIWQSGIRSRRDLEREIKRIEPDAYQTTIARHVAKHWAKFKSVIDDRAEADRPGVYVARHKGSNISYVYSHDRISAERMLKLMISPLLGEIDIFLDQPGESTERAIEMNRHLAALHREEEILIQDQVSILDHRIEVCRFLQDVCRSLVSA